ncbi:MAG: radical SAM protein [Ignavibacteriales bacterium]
MRFIVKIVRFVFNGEWDVFMEGFQFTRKNLTIKARINMVLMRITQKIRLSRTLGVPYFISVEPASICNLNCPICPSGLHKSRRDPALLPLQDFKKLIDEVGEYLLFIQLWNWGEPFLNPDIYDMIAYAKRKGIIVVSSTNGHFLNNHDNIQKLIESGLDGLILAVDGTTQEVYEQYRIGGKLDQVLDGIRMLVKAKSESGAASPLLLFRMVINAFNEHQVDDFIQLGKNLGVDMSSLKKINCNMGGEDRSSYVLPQDGEYIRPRREQGFKYHCIIPWCNPILFSDGKIGLCGLAAQGETALQVISPGNSFRRIWQSKEARVFRNNLKKDHDHYQFCRSCDCREPDYDDSRFDIQKLK